MKVSQHLSNYELGNSNEAISYIPDIVEFRPTDISILDRLSSIVESKQYWKESSSLYEKLTLLTKQDSTQSLAYLKKRINADYHNVLLFLFFLFYRMILKLR